MKPERLTWIDYARGIAIILVVYRHVFQGLKESGIAIDNYRYLEYANIFFFSFRMPLFFIISGIFVTASLRKRGIKEYIATRAKTILYPYFLWACIQLTLQAIFARYTNGHPTLQSYLYLFYLPREIAQFWYLYALFNVALVYVLVKQKLHVSAMQNIGLGILMFYGSVLLYREKIDTGFAGDIMHYYVFFAIGDTISSYMMNRDNFTRFESWKLLLPLLCCFIAAQSYFLKANLSSGVEKYQFVEYHQPFIFLLIALTGCAFIINLTFVLQKKKILNWLPQLGRHSLYIYVAHVIIFAAVRILLTKVFGVNNVIILLASGIIAGLTVPVILYKLSVKFNIPWLFTLEKKDRTAIKPAVQVAENNN